MRFICNYCHNPCILEIQDEGDKPNTCPYCGGAEWEELRERNGRINRNEKPMEDDE